MQDEEQLIIEVFRCDPEQLEDAYIPSFCFSPHSKNRPFSNLEANGLIQIFEHLAPDISSPSVFLSIGL